MGRASPTETNREEKAYEETNTQHPAHLVYGALCLMPTAVFAEGNEDTPTQALTSVDITFPKPEEGKKIEMARQHPPVALTFLEFGPALWQQDGEPKKLKADDTYEKGQHLSAVFLPSTRRSPSQMTALTTATLLAMKTIRHFCFEALNAYDGQEDAYLWLAMFSGDPSMGDLKDLYIVGLYAIIRAQEAQTPLGYGQGAVQPHLHTPITLTSPPKNILGTVNDALPIIQCTMFPFTYADSGCLQAYISDGNHRGVCKEQQISPQPVSGGLCRNEGCKQDAPAYRKAGFFGKNYASGGVGLYAACAVRGW